MKNGIMILSLVALVGCAATDVYREVMLEEPVAKVRTYSEPQGMVHDALVQAVYMKNFIIDHEENENGMVLAKRFFQKGKRNIVLALQAKVMGTSSGRTQLFLNAVQTTERNYVADRTRFFLFIIPLPGGGGKEASHIKEGEKIVEDTRFYDDIFNLVEKNLMHQPTGPVPGEPLIPDAVSVGGIANEEKTEVK